MQVDSLATVLSNYPTKRAGYCLFWKNGLNMTMMKEEKKVASQKHCWVGFSAKRGFCKLVGYGSHQFRGVCFPPNSPDVSVG